MSPKRLALLKSLLAQPTAPFRESHVVDFVTRTLVAHRVPHFIDPVGNVVVGCASRAEYVRRVRTQGSTLPVLIAHMDHPGFHGVRWVSATRLRVKWHGGSPVNRLIGASVWLGRDGHGFVAEGRITKATLARSRRALDTAEVSVRAARWNGRRPEAPALYGGLRFRAPVWQSGRRLYTKAADDLVGVFAVLATAIDVQARGRAALPFLGLLTRAEEVGFIGAIGHFELGWLQRARRPIVCVSLETSRTLPGALIGQGPVVRLGDRRTVFAPRPLNALARLAQRVLPERHQRRVMDGGTCEATAATVYGFEAIGISVPLGNYHNQGFEGGPDSRGNEGPAPEFVHLDDVEGLLALCRALARPGIDWDSPWTPERRAYRKRLREHRSLLRPPR